jgi:hypothetical protein
MNYTDYHLVQEVYMKNHEIATHTLHHVADPDLFQVIGCLLRPLNGGSSQFQW